MTERRGPEYISAQEASRIRTRHRRKRGAAYGLVGSAIGISIAAAILTPMVQRGMRASQWATELSGPEWVAAETTVFAPDGQEALKWSEWSSDEVRVLEKGPIKVYVKYGVCTVWDFVANKGMTFDGESFFRETREAFYSRALRNWRMSFFRVKDGAEGALVGDVGPDEMRIRKLDDSRFLVEIWRRWGDARTLHSQTTFRLKEHPPELRFTPSKAVSWRDRREAELLASADNRMFVRLPPWPGSVTLLDSSKRTWRGMALNSIFPMRQFVYIPVDGPQLKLPENFIIETPIPGEEGLRRLPSKEPKVTTASLPNNFYARSFGDSEMFYFDFLMADFEGRTFNDLMRDAKGKALPPEVEGEIDIEDRRRGAKALMRASALRHELGEFAGRNILSLHWALANALERAGRSEEMRAPLMIVRDEMPREPLTPSERMELERGLVVLNPVE